MRMEKEMSKIEIEYHKIAKDGINYTFHNSHTVYECRSYRKAIGIAEIIMHALLMARYRLEAKYKTGGNTLHSETCTYDFSNGSYDLTMVVIR